MLSATVPIFCEPVSANMAPKKLTTNSIVDFQPTPEELERAKSIIKKASEEEKRSKMQAMSGYCRRNADANGHGDVAASRGEDRWEYLYRYMAFQHRKNGGTSRTTEEASEVKSHKIEKKRYTWFQLVKHFGEEKATRAEDST